VTALAARLAALSTRERALLAVAAATTTVVLAVLAAVAVRDDLATLRARVAAHERELLDVRRDAAVLRRGAAVPAGDGDGASLLARLETTAGGIVGRERIASMTPAAGAVEDGLAEERVAVRVTGASLADTVRLLHTLETASPPLHVARLELRKHPDDASRFDATVEVAELRAAP
jgi:hypothetical protein